MAPILILLAASVILPSEARAGSAQQAASYKSQGDAAFDERRYADALKAYQQALEQNRDARLHYNIAQALSAMDRYPEALVSYQAFIAEAPPGTMTDAQQAALFRLLDELKGKIGWLDLTCDVPGARVLVRGKSVAVTPMAGVVALNAGEAKVEVLAVGYKPWEQTLGLPGGTTRTLAVSLQRVDFLGLLDVTSNVAGARVYVDGVVRGATPTEVRLQAGTHVVEVKAQEHIAFRRVAKVEPGERSEVTATLERAPNYTLVYTGFGIGAVGVAAGAVTGILAYTRFSRAKTQCDQTTKLCGPAAQDDLQASKSWGVLATVAFGVGAAGIGLGTYGLMTAKPDTRVDLALAPGGVVLRGVY